MTNHISQHVTRLLLLSNPQSISPLNDSLSEFGFFEDIHLFCSVNLDSNYNNNNKAILLYFECILAV